MRIKQDTGIQRFKMQALVQRIPYEEKLRFFTQIGYGPHENQEPVHRSTARLRVPCCGRRFGKSDLSIPEALLASVLGGYSLIAAPTYKIGDVDFHKAMTYVDNEKTGLASLVAGEPKRSQGAQEVLFKTGGKLYVRTTDNPSSILGEGNDFVLFEEAAEEADPLVWEEYIRPTLWDRSGSAIFPSTPEGDDWYKGIFDKGQIKEGDWESWQYTSFDNPYLNVELLLSELEDMPEDVRNQEMYATFIESQGAVFKGYARVAVLDMLDEPDPESFYVMGLDLGKYKDWTVITIMDANTTDVAYVERFNQLDWNIQESRIKEVAWLWQSPILMDATAQGGDRILAALQDAIDFVTVAGYVYTNASKWALINQYSVAIQRGETRIFNKTVVDADGRPLGMIVNSEIGAFRYDRTVAGTLKVGAPAGKHDDVPNSHMLAYENARRHAGIGPRPGQPIDNQQGPVSVADVCKILRDEVIKPGKMYERRATRIRGRRL